MSKIVKNYIGASSSSSSSSHHLFYAMVYIIFLLLEVNVNYWLAMIMHYLQISVAFLSVCFFVQQFSMGCWMWGGDTGVIGVIVSIILLPIDYFICVQNMH